MPARCGGRRPVKLQTHNTPGLTFLLYLNSRMLHYVSVPNFDRFRVRSIFHGFTMYIRWVHRHHKSSASAGVIFLDAYLVENYRNEQGRPRQRPICYLGNVRQIDGCVPAAERELFLRGARQALDHAAAHEPIDQDQVLALLQRRLPPCSPEEVAELLRLQLTSFYETWTRDRVDCPDEELHRIISDVQSKSRRQHERVRGG